MILLVDANQGVQAQTFANFYLAFGNDLVIIPVLNKIDLKNANPEVVEKQLNNLFDIEKKDILRVCIISFNLNQSFFLHLRIISRIFRYLPSWVLVSKIYWKKL